MSDQPTLGQILPKGKQDKDAIHVAIISVVADQDMPPGTNVGIKQEGLSPDGLYIVTPAENNDTTSVGIIDPFLPLGVCKDQTCYLCLYPNAVTGMKHHWQHPEFDNNEVPVTPIEEMRGAILKEESEKWLTELAKSYGWEFFNYGDDHLSNLILFLSQHDHDSDHYLPFDTPCEFDGYSDEMWMHYENYTGEKAPDKTSEYRKSAPYFRCGC